MKWAIVFVFIIFSFCTFGQSKDRDEKVGHIYLALGQIFTPASFRIGHKFIEAGVLNREAVGINVLYRSGISYVAFGPILDLRDGMPGLYGGVGLIFDFFRVFGIRLEFNGSYGGSAFGHGEGLIGTSFFY